MADLSYVREEMIPEREPPVTEKGIIKWMRENLFSNIPNTILTLLALYFIYAILQAVLPWIFQSAWNADSLKECRAIIKDAYGPDADGACWGVIKDRWHQLLFGFYPPYPGIEYDGTNAPETGLPPYFRPVLAFVLMLIALAPVLFDRLPRKMLWFSVLYPFIAFWLFWGGSIWVPVVALFGFVLSGIVALTLPRIIGALAATVVALLAPPLWWILLAGPVAETLQTVLPIAIEPVESAKFGGFMLSVIIGMTGITLSLPIGILLALGRQSDLIAVKAICVGFIEFIRGVPLITLLFVASTLLNYFMPPGTNFDIILRVMIMVTLFSAAYMAEVIRGGLAALPRGQYEAAAALGLDYWKSMRLVIMPQALKISIPSIVGIFIGLFKDTTLVSIIGLMDPLGLTNAIRADQAWNGIVWELYGFIALMFFIFCFSMGRYSMYLERKLETGHR